MAQEAITYPLSLAVGGWGPSCENEANRQMLGTHEPWYVQRQHEQSEPPDSSSLHAFGSWLFHHRQHKECHISVTGEPCNRGKQASNIQTKDTANPFFPPEKQNNGPNTSNLWLLTFFPFLFQTILGLGSPEAWQMKEATPPETPVWSTGVRVNLGGAEIKRIDHN